MVVDMMMVAVGTRMVVVVVVRVMVAVVLVVETVGWDGRCRLAV